MRTALAAFLLAAAAGCGGGTTPSAPADPAKMQEQIKAAQKAESAQKPLPEIKAGENGAPPP